MRKRPTKTDCAIGDRLRQARKSAGLLQTELADLLEITPTMISQMELCKVRTRKVSAMAWAMATNVNFDWIWTGKDQE